MLRLHLGEVAIEAKSHLVGLDGPVQGAEVQECRGCIAGREAGGVWEGWEGMYGVGEEAKEWGAGGVKRAVEGV